MSYNKDYNNIIGQYDGSTISERTGLQIGQGLGKGTVNLTNGSSTGTVNNVTVTNTAGTSIGRNTNNFNIDSSLTNGNIAVIDSLTGDIYNLSIQYVSSTSFTITACGKLSYSLETHTSSVTFSGPSGTYEYFIGYKSLVKNNSLLIGTGSKVTFGGAFGNIVTGVNSLVISALYNNAAPVATGDRSISITNSSFENSGTASILIGTGTASGDSAVLISAVGWAASAIGDESLSINGTASGTASVAIQGGIATGYNSLAIMYGTASGGSSIAIGPSTASGSASLVLGSGGLASGDYSTVLGGSGTASGVRSLVLGYGTASGSNSIVSAGYNNSVVKIYSQGQGSIVLGLSRNSGSILGVMSTADKYSSMLGGNDNYIGVNGNTTINSTYNATIIASQNSAIYQSSTSDTSLMTHTGIWGGNNNFIRSLANLSSLRSANILASENCNITNNTGTQLFNNAILNSNGTTLQNTDNVTVIGGGGSTTITESNIVYIGKEIVGGKVATTVLSTALSNSSSTVYSNIISFNAKAGAVYRLRLIGTYQTDATTTGIKVRMSGTAVANVNGYITGEITTAIDSTGLKATIASMTAELITTGVSVINTPHAIDGDIIVRCTTAGTVILQMASEVNFSSAQLNIGTAVIVERVI